MAVAVRGVADVLPPESRLRCLTAGAVAALWLGMAVSVRAVDSFELPPISYSVADPKNVVATLGDRLDRGEVGLQFDDATGYLRSVLDALEVPVSSQTLVFSKTSLQQRHISPKSPRAIYFNDDVYVGYVRGGDVLEISVADPDLGTVFYTLDQQADEPPRLVRQTESCLLCHGGSHTRGVPGHIVRSVYPDRSGQPIFAAGSHRVDDTTPFHERWGGWYVTGRHGATHHLGNITFRRRPEPGDDPDSSGLNQVDLQARFDTTGYLSPHSDIVALSVLAHQAAAHTVLARASFDARTALHREAALNREVGEPSDHRWASTTTVLDSAAESLVVCFLMGGSAPFSAPIEGTTQFADEFAVAGPTDERGRSLRSLNLQSRLLQHPCSFLIYSASFDALPLELRQRFWARLDGVLVRGEGGESFAHLSPADRTAIREILAATKPGVPTDWLLPAANPPNIEPTNAVSDR